MSVEFLRRIPLFEGLPEADLELLYQMAKPVTVATGEVFIQEGVLGDALYVILDGEVEVTKRAGQSETVLTVYGPGQVVGEMALLDRQPRPRSASVRALRPCRMLMISRDAFHRMLACSPSAPLEMVRMVMMRLRNSESVRIQHEKMAGLGTMAAGFAHELNNPAAAARRSTAQLREAVDDLEQASWTLLDLALTSTQHAKLRALRDEVKQHPPPSAVLDPLAASDLEDAAATWLDERGVDDAWELAPMIAQLQWDEAVLDRLLADFSPAQLPAVLRWLAAGALVSTLVDEIGRSVGGISEIVKSVKDYSYLDQAAIQEIDLHQSLDNTLVLMRHKLEGGVIVHRDYAPDLPKIEAFGSELNQVWTNLIDNAADAMGVQGHLTLRTRVHGDDVVVEIADSGPGIPHEVQPRIFDPFYTTKPAGVGTGLGLHIVYNIVAHRHRGHIDVTSRPGETRFRITLPQRLPRSEVAPVG